MVSLCIILEPGKKILNEKIGKDNLMEYLTSDKDRHIDIFSRFNYNLLSPVSDFFNFRLNLTITNSFGYFVNGRFDGMVGALEQQKIDMGCSPVFFREDRSKVTSYTARTWIARFGCFLSFFFNLTKNAEEKWPDSNRPCFVFRTPSDLSKSSDRAIFLQPFTNNVWLCLGICGALLVLLLWMFSYVEGHFKWMGGKYLDFLYFFVYF